MKEKISESSLCEFRSITEHDGEIVALFAKDPMVVSLAYPHIEKNEYFYVPVTELFNRVSELDKLGFDCVETHNAMVAYDSITNLWDQGVFKRYKTLPVMTDAPIQEAN